MAAPDVSILLPARDAAATLPSCLASVHRQRGVTWECVLVDDGSVDETLTAARALIAGDPRFTVLAEPRCGLVAALNAGLAHCRAPIVARMDADDLMHRERLALQLRALARTPALAAVGTHVRLFPRRSLTEGRRGYETWLNGIDSPARVRADAFVECPIAHPSLAIRRPVLASLGYRDEGWPEDYDLVLRLLGAGHEIGVVPRRLLAWRDRPGRLSRTSPAYTGERFTACKAAFLAAGFLAATDRYILWGYGSTGRLLARALRRHGKLCAHVVDLHPGRLGKQIHGAPVIPPEALPQVPRLPIVASVAFDEPRREVRAMLAQLGFVELRDFVCAA